MLMSALGLEWRQAGYDMRNVNVFKSGRTRKIGKCREKRLDASCDWLIKKKGYIIGLYGTIGKECP